MTTTSIIQVSQPFFSSHRSSPAFLLAPCQPVPTHLHDPNPIHGPHIIHFLVNVLSSYACFPLCPWIWIKSIILLLCFLLQMLNNDGETSHSNKDSVTPNIHGEQTLLVYYTLWQCVLSCLILQGIYFKPSLVSVPAPQQIPYVLLQKGYKKPLVENHLSMLLHMEQSRGAAHIPLLLLSCHSGRSTTKPLLRQCSASFILLPPMIIPSPEASFPSLYAGIYHQHLSLLRISHPKMSSLNSHCALNCVSPKFIR